jgi:hypothetical protein
VRIAGRAAGDVVSVSGPVRVSGRVDGDLIAVSDRAFLGSTARVGGDLRYGDERPVLARGARVGGEISNEDWADAASGWGWVSVMGWWLAVSVSTLIVGVLFVLLAPAALYAAERVVRERLGATVAWGVAITIGVPLLAVLAPLIPVAGRPRRARGHGPGTGSAGRGPMAGRQARRAYGEAGGAGSRPSRTSCLTLPPAGRNEVVTDVARCRRDMTELACD